MPGLIMEHSTQNRLPSNHDRDHQPNGFNGDRTSEATQDARKESEQSRRMSSLNGINGGPEEELGRQPSISSVITSSNAMERLSDLPPEIAHITQGYEPLSRLLTRTAQRTHQRLSSTILELAQMPVPGAAVNGNGAHQAALEDSSVDNVNKKLKLLKFAQNAHAEWTKALVITSWSRRAEEISKAIDLKVHLDNHKFYYQSAFHEMSEAKRSLIHARLPNPDLKTAIAVLTTGKAPWMPDLGYIRPTPLTDREVLKVLEDLNTLLSIRLNLHDYDKIPWQFRDYRIHSGRVRFGVSGEFDVDLTIGEEDPEKQFWFIDFRLAFSPAPRSIPLRFKLHLENRVNAILATEGLTGCYNFLHEIVLTHKISEFRRQARELAIGRWVEGLRIEQLNRTLSVQYWVDRYGRKGRKSFILLGVHSGRRRDGYPDPKRDSKLSLRWFRDGKEMKDEEIAFDDVNISTERLLKTIVAKHVSHILTSIYEKLRVEPIFASHEAALSLVLSDDEPSESQMKLQLTSKIHITIGIDQVSGRFVFSPASHRIIGMERGLNFRSPNPTIDGHEWIENLRCLAIMDDIMTHGLTVGWIRTPPPLIRRDELNAVLPVDKKQVAWFQRPGWKKEWFIALSVGMSGERWYLFEIANIPPTINYPKGIKIAAHIDVPIKSVAPVASYHFMSSLPVFAAALIAHYTNLRVLHKRHILRQLRRSNLKSPINIPAVFFRLSDVLGDKIRSKRTQRPWAKDYVKVTFQGLERVQVKAIKGSSGPAKDPASSPKNKALSSRPAEKAILISEARIITPSATALNTLKGKVDHDIAFHEESGCFAFRLRSEVGESVIPTLFERLKSVSRLIDFAEILHEHESTLLCEIISLNSISITYPRLPSPSPVPPAQSTYKATIDFAPATNNKATETNMIIALQKCNPHLRILDKLNDILNSPLEGIEGIAILIPLTLPILRAFDSIESRWESASHIAEPMVFVRAIDYYLLRYTIFPYPSSDKQDSSASAGENKVEVKEAKTITIAFKINLLQRRGSPWWAVRRVEGRDYRSDDLDSALRTRIWDAKGEHGWLGMRSSAIARNERAEAMMEAVDEVVRSVIEAKGDITEIPVAGSNDAQGQKQSGKGGLLTPVQSQGSQGGGMPTVHLQMQQIQVPALQQQRNGQKGNQQTQNQQQGQGPRGTKRDYVEID